MADYIFYSEMSCFYIFLSKQAESNLKRYEKKSEGACDLLAILLNEMNMQQNVVQFRMEILLSE